MATKRKPTPAQIAARERFAAMARSGAFKKKASKARKNPAPLKMKIRGSETPDNPEGLIVTEAGALRFAKANMPADLKRAGFVPSVVAGARGWSINYGKAVPGHSSYKRNPRASNPIASKRKRNPQAPSIKHKGARNIAYAVEAKRMIAGGGAQFEMIAGFPTKAQAQDYIDALLKSYPKGLTLRISAA